MITIHGMTFILLCAGGIWATFAYIHISRVLRATRQELDETKNKLAQSDKLKSMLSDYVNAYNKSEYQKAVVIEYADEYYFAVCRRSNGNDFVIRRFYYSLFDPDDRDYSRICAEELAEMLNEKP